MEGVEPDLTTGSISEPSAVDPPPWSQVVPTPVRSTRSADLDGDVAPRPLVQGSSHGDVLKAEVVFNL